MNASVKKLSGGIDSDYYYAIEIDGIIFKMGAAAYSRLANCQQDDEKYHKKAIKLINNIADIINIVDDLGGIDNMENLANGFCSYKLNDQCNQQ